MIDETIIMTDSIKLETVQENEIDRVADFNDESHCQSDIEMVKQEIGETSDSEDCATYIYSEQWERPLLVLLPDFVEEEYGAVQEGLRDPLAEDSADGISEETNPLLAGEWKRPKLEDKEGEEEPGECIELKHENKEREEQPIEPIGPNLGHEEREQQLPAAAGPTTPQPPEHLRAAKGSLFNKKPFRCKVCRKAYKIAHALKTHTERSHPHYKECSNELENVSQPPSDRQSAGVGLLTASCPNTEAGDQAKTTRESLLCNHCGKPFKTTRELMLHHKKQRTKVHCDVCGCILSNRFWLMRHMALAHDGEPFLHEGGVRRRYESGGVVAASVRPTPTSDQEMFVSYPCLIGIEQFSVESFCNQ